MIRSGTTTYVDMYYFEEELRKRRKRQASRCARPTVIEFPLSRREDIRGLASPAPEEFIKQFAKDDLIVPAVAPHSVYTLNADTLTNE